MNNTTNMICVFLGGITVGALGTYGVMKRLGYSKFDDMTIIDQEQEEEVQQELPKEDVPSFTKPESIDTQKVKYHMPDKPTLEELSKKYRDPSFDKTMASREHPEEDLPVEDDEDEELMKEIAEALMEHPGQYEDEVHETDGFGHVIMQLATKRSTDVIYLIPEEYSGEIYPIEDLRWFEKDNVLVDVTDTPIDDPDHVIGSALDHFGDCGPQDMVFARNVNLGYEYEVTRVEAAFGAYIYGVSDEDSKIPSKSGTHPAKARQQKKKEKEMEE